MSREEFVMLFIKSSSEVKDHVEQVLTAHPQQLESQESIVYTSHIIQEL